MLQKSQLNCEGIMGLKKTKLLQNHNRAACKCGKKFRGGDRLIGVTNLQNKAQEWWICQKCKTSYLVIRDCKQKEKFWSQQQKLELKA